eukprot:CAMPEP_0115003048 /NCGR_PEP_ID=MMETSP0216-20121206/18367_1 /TAXON_ID=223996 /ORGANISM="Protocruzia adherens, Strain Boccale" /LENGTH=299 /DNA_ID=CAMNT_0002368755 /DNA_START=34 /DNA_END=929 /DNA_ORIENTATION=+
MEGKIAVISQSLSALGYPDLGIESDSTSNQVDEEESLHTLLAVNFQHSHHYKLTKHLYKPNNHRQSLFKWLINSYDASLLTDPEVNIINLSENQQIAVALGFLGFSSIDEDSVGAMRGFEQAVWSVYDFVKFVTHAKRVDVSLEKASGVFQEQRNLMRYIAQNMEDIVSSKCRIFPPSFPGSGNEDVYDVDDLQEMLVKWQSDVQKLEHNLDYLDNRYEENKLDISALTELLGQLKGSIQHFLEIYGVFNEEYESNFKNQMYKISANLDEAGLGEASAKCNNKLKQFKELGASLQGIWT